MVTDFAFWSSWLGVMQVFRVTENLQITNNQYCKYLTNFPIAPYFNTPSYGYHNYCVHKNKYRAKRKSCYDNCLDT